MKTKILLWGAGNRTREFFQTGFFTNCEIIAIVDSFSERQIYFGYPVIRPGRILEFFDKIDFIVICNQFYIEIIDAIKDLGISLDKVIITDHSLDPVYRQCFERAKDILPDAYEAKKHQILKTVRLNAQDLSDDSTIFGDSRFSNTMEYYQDYFRYRTFEFLAEEISAAGIEGSVAEFGVFRGSFAALINQKFCDRKLYLFDSFEGFEPSEAEAEKKLGRCEEGFIISHKDTSVEILMNKLPHPQNAVICKGFFPESITEEAREERFAFVSLDVDFEESTYQGLEFFYPRLSEGGYMMIHDYKTYSVNAHFLEGVGKAVERYERKLGARLKKVPIADGAGTLIVVK